METSSLIILGFYIILVVILWKIFKTIAKAFFFASLIIIILLAGAFFVVLKDAQSFSKGAETGVGVYVDNQGQLISGFILKNNLPQQLSDQDISAASALYTSEEYEELLDTQFKFFAMTQELIDSLDDVSVSQQGVDISDAEVRTVLKGGALPDRLRAYPQGELEMFVVSSVFSDHIISNPLVMIAGYKAKTLIVYPETAMFWVFKYIPLSIVKLSTLQLVDKGTGVVEEVAVERIA